MTTEAIHTNGTIFTESVEPKPRGPLAQALSRLEGELQLRISCAMELEAASKLRCGLLDSDSRRAEVQEQIQKTLAQVAQRLRGVM